MTIFQALLEFHRQIKPEITDADIQDIKDCLREIHKLQKELSVRYMEITNFIDKRDRLNRPSKILTSIAKEREKANKNE